MGHTHGLTAFPLVAPGTREHTVRIVAVDVAKGIFTTERPHGLMQDGDGARSCVRLVGADLPGGTSSALNYRAVLKQAGWQASPFQFKLSATPIVSDSRGNGANSITLTDAGTLPFYALTRLDTGNDRALDKIVSYLQTFMNVYGAAAYRAIRPNARVSAGENLPVLYTTIGNPVTLFREDLTPGLWAYRKAPHEFTRQCADYSVSSSSIMLSWRLPPITFHEYSEGFEEQLNAFSRLVRSAFDFQRDPAHIEADDDEPQAQEYGTIVKTRAHLMQCDVIRVETTPLEIPMREEGPQNAQERRISFGLTITLDVAEMADPHIERYPETPETFEWL